MTEQFCSVPQLKQPWKIWLIFFIGITSVICFRVVIIANFFNKFMGTICWYTAVISSVIFFGYRYHISCRRYRTVQSQSLAQKVNRQQPLSELDYQALKYVLNSIVISKERLNYVLIFVLSALSLLVAIFLDLRQWIR